MLKTDIFNFQSKISLRKLGLSLLLLSIIFPFRLPGDIAITWVVVLSFILFFTIKQALKNSFRFPFKLLAYFILFTLFAFISIIAAPDRVLCLNKLLIWCLSICFIIVVDDLINCTRDSSDFLKLIFLCSIVVGIIGMLIIVSGLIFGTNKIFYLLLFKMMPYFKSQPNWESFVYKSEFFHQYLNWTVKDGSIFRNISIFLSPIATAGFYGLLAPIALSLYFSEKTGSSYLFIFLFIIANILLTMTRGSWIALSFACIFVLLKSRSAMKKLVVYLFILLFVTMTFSIEAFNERIFSKSSAARKSIATRISYLQRGFEIGKENYFIGIGFANYENFVQSDTHEYPHNQYIELLAETGLGGLFSYIMIMIVTFKRNLAKIRLATNSYNKRLYIGIVGSIIFFIVYSLFEDLIATPPIFLTFMTILGFAEAKFTIAKRMLKVN